MSLLLVEAYRGIKERRQIPTDVEKARGLARGIFLQAQGLINAYKDDFPSSWDDIDASLRYFYAPGSGSKLLTKVPVHKEEIQVLITLSQDYSRVSIGVQDKGEHLEIYSDGRWEKGLHPSGDSDYYAKHRETVSIDDVLDYGKLLGEVGIAYNPQAPVRLHR